MSKVSQIVIFVLISLAILILLSGKVKAGYQGGQACSDHWVCNPQVACGGGDVCAPGPCCWQTRCCDTCGQQDSSLIWCMVSSSGGLGACSFSCGATPSPTPTSTPTPTSAPLPTPPPGCTLTNPLNPHVNAADITDSSAILRWTSPTTKGIELRMRLDTNQVDVENGSGCPGTSCILKDNGLGKNTTSYNTATVPSPPVSLSPGRRYYWRVVNWESSTCYVPSATDTFITDCQVSLNSPTDPFAPGTSQTITATVTANATLIDHVKFSMPITTVASLNINPKNDQTSPYSVIVNGDNIGSTTLNANVYYSAGGSSRCATSIPINITNPYTLQAKVHEVTDPAASCTTIAGAGSPSPLIPRTIALLSGSTNYPQSGTQIDVNAVSFPNLTIGTDTLDTTAPSGYTLVRSCRSINGSPTYTETNVASGQVTSDTVQFDIGYVKNIYTLEVNAHEVTDPNATCDTIAATPYSPTSPLFPKTISLSAGTNAPQSGTQTNGTPVSFPNLALGTDTLDTTAPPGYALVKSCLSNVAIPGVYTQTDTTTGQAPSDTMLFDVGYIKNTYTLKAKAHKITDTTLDCTAIPSEPALDNVTFSVDTASGPPDPTPQVSGGLGVTFSDLAIPALGSDFLTGTAETGSGYSPVKYCLSKNGGTSALSPDRAANGQSPNDVYQFDVAYVFGTPWVQVQGGDVTVNSNISSTIPDSATTPVFLGPYTLGGVLPGLVTYGGTTADFDPSPDVDGIPAKVSSNTWLLNEQYTQFATKDYYAQFYNKLGAPTTDNYPDPANLAVANPDLSGTYYVAGSMTTTGDWVIKNDDKIIFLVNGNLTIKGKITRTGTGFIAFVVKGDITVDPSVGVDPTSTTPVVEGLYVSKGTFHTGSSIAGKEKFVGKGIFIAGDFSLERDLDIVSPGNNAFYPSELFIFDPQLLFLLPNPFRETSVTWQEVAP